MGADGAHAPLAARLTALEQALRGADRSRIWLAISILGGELPDDSTVLAAHRTVELDGPAAALVPLLRPYWFTGTLGPVANEVQVIRDAVVVDMHHTSKTDLATGIQRVARETVARWESKQDITLVGWTSSLTAFTRLDRPTRRRALGRETSEKDTADTAPDVAPVMVPWNCTYIMPELVTESDRTCRLLAMARHSGNRLGLIGFDCVPLTTAETTVEAMRGAFAQLMAAVRHMDAVVAISEASANEYRGWRTMLASTGVEGPSISAVGLPASHQPPSENVMAESRQRFLVGSLPMVLCVGSHEPRKNHLAVLHAAELLWRRGLEFSLLFIGGNSWKSDEFQTRLRVLRDVGRLVDVASAISDEELSAAYELAHVSVFPSINEGFGLPVAESLAAGTPAITSGFGSMAEIVGDKGGAILVDPRDDHAIAEALERMLNDDDLHAQLVAEANSRDPRSWDDYARELWAELVEPILPPQDQRYDTNEGGQP